MRLAIFLLLVSTTLLHAVQCEIALVESSQVEARKTARSLVDSVSEELNNISSNRFSRLRAEDTKDAGPAKEEERFNIKNIFGNRDFASSKLKKMAQDANFRQDTFKKWDKYTYGQIRSHLNVDKYHPSEAKLFFYYMNVFKKTPQVKPDRNTRVHFDVNPPQVRTIEEIDKAIKAAAKVTQ